MDSGRQGGKEERREGGEEGREEGKEEKRVEEGEGVRKIRKKRRRKGDHAG